MSGEPTDKLVLFRRRGRRGAQRRAVGHLLLPAANGDAPAGHWDEGRDQARRDVLDVRAEPDGRVLAVHPHGQRRRRTRQWDRLAHQADVPGRVHLCQHAVWLGICEHHQRLVRCCTDDHPVGYSAAVALGDWYIIPPARRMVIKTEVVGCTA